MPAPRRLLRRLLIGFGLTAGLAIIAVALLPTMINAGLGHGWLRSRLAAMVAGDADFAGLEVRWRGEQRIRGLAIASADGRTRIDGDVLVRHDLLGLLGRPDTLDVTVRGSVRGWIDETGATGFPGLLAGGGAGSAATTPDAPTAPAARGLRVPQGVRLDLQHLAVTLDVAVGDAVRPLELTAVTGRVHGGPGRPLEVRLETPTRFTGTDGAIEVELQVRDLVGPDGRLRPEAFVIEAARLAGRGVPLPAGRETVLLEEFLATASGRPGERLDVQVEARGRGLGLPEDAPASRLQVAGHVTGLARDGRLDPVGAAWSLQAEGLGLPTAPLARLLPALAEAGLDPAVDLGPLVAVEIDAGTADGDAVAVRIEGAAARLEARGRMLAGRRLAVEAATLEAAVRPEVVARLASVGIAAAVPVRVDLDAMTLDLEARPPSPEGPVRARFASAAAAEIVAEVPLDGGSPLLARVVEFAGDLVLEPGGDASARLRFDGVAVEHPRLAAAISAASLTADLAAAAAGETTVHLAETAVAAGGRPLARVSGMVTRPGDAAEPGAFEARLAGIDAAAAESLLGLEPGAIADWTGGGGEVTVRGTPAAGTTVSLALNLPAVAGEARMQMRGDRLDLDARDLVLRPTDRMLAALGRPATADRPAVRLAADGSRVLRTNLRVTGLATTDPAAWPESFRLEAAATPVRVQVGETAVPLGPTRWTITREPGAPLAVRITGEEGDAATLEADLRITGLPEPGRSGRPDPAALRITGHLEAADIAAAICDALLGAEDLVAATMGATVTARIDAADFGTHGGSLRLEVSGPTGRVDGTVRGERGALVVDPAAPLTAVLEVHPLVRDRVLSRIQPIFSGVSRSDGPLRVVISSAFVPLGDGVSAAAAEFRAEPATLWIEPGFDFLGLVAMFDRRGGRPLEATLQPVQGRLAGGRIVTDATRLVLSRGASIDFAAGGVIDLETRRTDIRATMPLKWLGSVFREAREIADSVTVPLLARGPFGTPLEVDPSFDLGRALLEAGIGGLLERELDRVVPGLGDLFRGLGGG